VYPCPDTDKLQQLLDERVSEEEYRTLEAHLEECPPCLAALERLTAPAAAVLLPSPGKKIALIVANPTAAVAEIAGTLPGLRGYCVLEKLGYGGSGVVYKAQQDGLDRTVALKMIRAGAQASEEDLGRFRTEAQAVARLQHANIVQVYEIGEHAGCPFFSMELVSGESLANRLRQGPLGARPAAELVATLARAMHYAHEHGIIHRDLKPANVLLTADGVPKIADFGLAKCLDVAQGQTATGAVLGTPSYMAPEQAQGKTKEIGPAADVYALGAILYELLTGCPPFRGESTLDTLEQVRTKEPVPPRQLQLKIPPDLQTICLKALDKERGRRYPTALELADDLQRWHRGEPIRARSAGPIKRLGRWSRRNPQVAGLTAAVILLFLLAFALVTWQWRRAEFNYQRSQEVLHHTISDVGTLPKKYGHELESRSGVQLLRKNLLREVVEHVQERAQLQPNEPLIQHELAHAWLVYGVATSQTGKLDEALDCYQLAATLFPQTGLEHIKHAVAQDHLAATYFYIGLLRYATGQMDEALHSYRKGLGIWEQLGIQYQDNNIYLRNQALSYWGIADAYLALGRTREALDYHQQARAMRLQLVAHKPNDLNLLYHLAYSHDSMGMLLHLTDQPDAALASLEKARDLRQRLLKHNPDHIWWQYDLARTDLKRGAVYHALRRTDEALGCWEEARTALEPLVRDNSCVMDFQRHLAEAYLQLGNLHRVRRQYAEALRRLEKARHICLGLLVDNPAVTQSRVILAEVHAGLARIHQDQGEPLKALRCHREAEAVWEQLVRDHPPVPHFRSGLLGTYFALANLHRAGQRPSEADRFDQQARAIQEQLVRECPDLPGYARPLIEP
jgi:tetratricopeptide (TPR) repeat protein/predicted Ser/Thr protein kinase